MSFNYLGGDEMKRNFLTGIAMMVAAFFIGTEIAQAADVSFSGSIRTRYENETKSGFKTRHEAYDLTATQIRLNAKANINSDTSAFVQMQSAHTWGTNNAAYTASDANASVGIHQGYFTLKNFAGLPVSAKIGRQEIVLDGHRLFGHTGWTTGAQTHDAAVFKHSHGNSNWTYGYSMAQEQTTKTGTDDDIGAHVLHGNFQGVLGGALSTYLVMMDDDCSTLSQTSCGGATNRWFTIGARQAGKMYGLDYRAEYYYQTGAAGNARNAIGEGNVLTAHGTAHGLAGYTDETARNAYMFGLRVGKSFKNLPMSPKITLWYDYLSGNDDEAMEDGEWSAFDTLFDTGHKFYGFMDLFLSNTGGATDYLGLQDIAVKIVLKPRAKWTFKADIHNFRTAQTLSSSPDLATRLGHFTCTSDAENVRSCSNNRNNNNEIGTEVDLTLVHAYNPNVKLSFGYSQFMAENLYHMLAGKTGDNANSARWAYVQAAVKF